MADEKEIYTRLEGEFRHWEIIKDVIDQQIDLMLNHRQSGHPGGSRSKVHALVATTLGFMRWDIRDPSKRFADRFVLVAGHTAPAVYALLATYHEALRVMHEKTGEAKYDVRFGQRWRLTWEDLLTLRRRNGLPGHVEMEGKTLFCKWNTGPSGHGAPAAAGQAFALKRAGAGEVRVFAVDGEGGHTAGAWHETKNSAYGLGLSNFTVLLDWNDFGIDENPISSVVKGSPTDWFEPYGFHAHAAEQGSEWSSVTRALAGCIHGENPKDAPGVAWFKTIKGRGYIVTGNKSHGKSHAANSENFWTLRKEFADKYGVEFAGHGSPRPESDDAFRDETAAAMKLALSVLIEKHPETCEYLANRLVELGESVPLELATAKLDDAKNPLDDAALWDYRNYPEDLYLAPGTKAANRKGLDLFGRWINSYCAKKYERPLFLACSADLAESTNIAGFMKGRDGFDGWGWFDREKNLDGVLLPQMITEFANSGITAGAASVNLASNPLLNFNGFYTACSTYGSFVYLKYGLMRLFSQLSQECDLKLGKVLWIASHSGPETAEDSRTHFGIFSPGVTQLFPDGHVIDIHPFEANEVPVMIAAGMATERTIIALHLTRPPVEIPDRKALGLGSHFEAAKGAYVLRAANPDKPRDGTVIVQGTMSTVNLIQALPALDAQGLNLKFVAAPSPQLFALQSEEYQLEVLTEEDRLDSVVVSNRSRRLMGDWVWNRENLEYAMTADWDDRWRTGGSVDEIIDEAHLSPAWITKGIQKFVASRPRRLGKLSSAATSVLDGR